MDGTGGKWTANAGTYEDAVGINAGELKNYEVRVNKGDATVNKAQLTINVGKAETTYGTAFDESKYGYNLEGLTNGDEESSVAAEIGSSYTNDAALDGTGGKWTADAGTHENAIGISVGKLTNYEVSVNKGDATVTVKNINISANNQNVIVGEKPNYTGTDINDELVNGDTISDGLYDYGVNADVDVNVEGSYTIGIYVDGSYYELSTPNWSSVTGLDFLKNYNITFNPGTLTVTDQVLPDLPDNWPSNRWDYLFSDNPFDRNKNFRERKAEVNFVDGGMEI